MKPVPSFLGFGTGTQTVSGRAHEIRFADAHGTDLVVVRMRILEFAQLATLHHQDFPINPTSVRTTLKLLPEVSKTNRSCGAVYFFAQLGSWPIGTWLNIFSITADAGVASLQQRGGESVQVGITADHPTGVVCVFCFCVHFHGLLG
ncbi:MAG: hypothetical protein WCH99_06220 [Verrucomicrobiota bacterium]